MKPVSPELLALLKTRQFYSADLFTFWGGNLGSTVLRFTSGDMDITANGLVYSAGGLTGPYFDRKDNKAKVTWKIGTEADNLVFDVLPGSYEIFGVRMQTAVKYGLFDGSTILLERCYMPSYGDTRVGTIRYFLGRVSSIDSGRSVITFSASSHLELLNLQLPRNLYQSSCINNWGDKGCGVNKESYKTTGAVTDISTTALVLGSIDAGPYADGTFDQGKLVFTSGPLVSLQASVRKCTFDTPNQIQLLGFLPIAPEVGDTYNIYYGCDKSLGSNGCIKFANTPNFRAQRLIPLPSTII